jgi:hypothetical protein
VLLIGIDEAGYGPKLGPLCHGYSAIRCAPNGGSTPPDLWELLHPSVMKHPACEGSVPVDDSKRIHSADRTLTALSLGVRSFLNCISSEIAPSEVPEHLYDHLLPHDDRSRLAEDVWAAVPPPLEKGGPGGSVSDDASAPVESSRKKNSRRKSAAPAAPPTSIPPLKETLTARSVSVVAVGARAMSARHYNAALKNGNKADVSWTVIVSQLEALLRLAQPGEDVYVSIDRQGGRKFYAGRMGHLFAGAMPWVESETPQQSVYKIEHDGRTIRVAFIVNADGLHFPVALGSMAAKLTRELCMRRLNAWFQSHEPSLKPTAGYYGDAARFLRETKALRKKLGIANEVLIRDK